MTLTAVGDEFSWSGAITRVVLPSMLLNTLITPILYVPVRWATTVTAPVGPIVRVPG